MEAKDLKEFIDKNNVEYHWLVDDSGKSNVIIFPEIHLIKEFNDLLIIRLFEGGGIECTMREGYFSFWMKDICEYYEIKLEDIFEI